MGVDDLRIRLIVRGDDAGSCPSANRAIREACGAGVLRNVSVMASGPAFTEAARLLAGLGNDICLGLHVTLNAEWDGPKWGPVLPPERVPSLVDANGNFLPTPRDLLRRGFSVDEAVAEAEAQLARARAAGLPIAYLYEHMGVGAAQPGLRARLADLARREGLVDAHPIPFLPDAPPDDPTADDLPARIGARLRAAAVAVALDTGAFVLVTHPGIDADDMRGFIHPGLEPGQVAHERDAERRALCDPRLARILAEHGATPARYTDLLPATSTGGPTP
jgi:predicted glycoside hydrolase/deacetylase ChbG (UPF0249 family)